MSGTQGKKIEDIISDFLAQNKEGFDRIMEAFEPFVKTKTGKQRRHDAGRNRADERSKERGHETHDAPRPDGPFDAASYPWDARAAYYIEAPDKRIVTGAVIFDDKLGFTKSCTLGDGKVQTMTYVPLADVAYGRQATPAEREYLHGEPTLEEALQIIKSKMNSPREERAFRVLMKELTKKD